MEFYNKNLKIHTNLKVNAILCKINTLYIFVFFNFLLLSIKSIFGVSLKTIIQTKLLKQILSENLKVIINFKILFGKFSLYMEFILFKICRIEFVV